MPDGRSEFDQASRSSRHPAEPVAKPSRNVRYLRIPAGWCRRRAVIADCTGYAPVGRIVTVRRTAEKGGIGGVQGPPGKAWCPPEAEIPAGTVLEPIGSPLVPTLVDRPSEEQCSPVSPRAFGKGRKIPPVTRDGVSGHFSGVGREIHAVISRYANSSISGSRRKMLKSRMLQAEIVASTRS
jgi:hypothetical protein